MNACASPTAGATCAKTAANVDNMVNVTQSMATAPARRGGGCLHVPKPVCATPEHPPATKPQAAVCVTISTGAKSAVCAAIATCLLASSTMGNASASMVGGVQAVTAVATVISTMLTASHRTAPVCATLVIKVLTATYPALMENMAEVVRRGECLVIVYPKFKFVIISSPNVIPNPFVFGYTLCRLSLKHKFVYLNIPYVMRIFVFSSACVYE